MDRRSIFRRARDLYGELLGATRRAIRREAMKAFADLDPGERDYVLAQIGYMNIRAIGEVHDLLRRMERWAERNDQREQLRDEADREAGFDPFEPEPEEAEAEVAAGAEEEEPPQPLPPPVKKGTTVPPPVQKGTTGTAGQVLAVACPTCEPGVVGKQCRTRSGNECPPHAARLGLAYPENGAGAPPEMVRSPDEVIDAPGAAPTSP